MISLEERTRIDTIETEKRRKNKEKYKIQIFDDGIIYYGFLLIFSIIFIIGIVTLVQERNLWTRYDQYNIFLRIFGGIGLLFGICDDMKESWKKRFALKPEKQIGLYQYEGGFIYTDSLFNVIIYTIYKVIAWIISIAGIIILGYLLIVFLKNSIQEMSLKAIVIIGIVIIIGLLIMIFNKLKNKEKNN